MADSDLTAAELALGLLDGDERATALRRVLAEPGFAREVEAWRAHFAQLFVDWPEMTAPETALGRIERAIDRPETEPTARTRGIWPGVAIVSMLVAASLLLVLMLRPATQIMTPAPTAKVAATPVLVAQLAPSDNAAITAKPVAAIYDPASGGLRVARAAFAEADHSAELWVIPEGGVPHALGLLRDDDRTEVNISADNRRRLAAGATLAVSIEPVGGSPTDAPTGPVVATGTLALV